MLRIFVALACVLPISSSLARAQVCTGFQSGLGLAGADGPILCSTVHDDGSGPALYAAGAFTSVGNLAATCIARWDGSQWTTFGNDVDFIIPGSGRIDALLSYGGRLYAGGKFSMNGVLPEVHLATWDGAHWSVVPGQPDGEVSALSMFHSALMVGGDFEHAGSSTCNRVARFDPVTSTWSPLGAGFWTGTVRCFATYHEPGGDRLFVGGDQISLAVGSSYPIARWDGSAWSLPVGLLPIGSSEVWSLLVHDDGSGPELWAGGLFEVAGGSGAYDLARWNGSSWSPVGPSSIDSISLSMPVVRTLVEHDDGSGSAVYAGGSFESASGVTSHDVVRWRNGAFQAVAGAPDDPIWTLASFGNQLVAAGPKRSSAWDGVTWRSIVAGGSPGGWPFAMCSHDDGSGPALYAAVRNLGSPLGAFPPALQRWSHGAWSTVPNTPTLTNPISFLSADDPASPGHFLYAGAWFPASSGAWYQGVERWDGTGWTQLGPTGSLGCNVYALASHRESGAQRIFACGDFTSLGGAAANRIARWDGTAWSALGTGLGTGWCTSLCELDEGSGPALIVGGSFSTAGGISAVGLARWDGTSWSSVGGGVFGWVQSMVVHDDGTGPALYVSGSFSSVGGVLQVSNVACWKNGTWTGVGQGLSAIDPSQSQVRALAWFNDGSGPALYATGKFSRSGTIDGLQGIARFDGTNWTAIGSGLGPIENDFGLLGPDGWSLAVHEDGLPQLWVGGQFGSAGDVVSDGVARLCDQVSATNVVCAGDGLGTGCPCGNDSAVGQDAGCLSSIGVGATLRVYGIASVSADDVELIGAQMTNSFCLYLQGATTLSGGGHVLGDGLRCAGGTLVRLGARVNTAGGSIFPGSSSAPRISSLGSVSAGNVRTYQVWYRNAASFCTPSTFNLTNGVELTWLP